MSEEQISKPKHVRTIALTSNLPESRERKLSMSNLTFWMIILGCCVAIGIVAGVLYYESKMVIDISRNADMQQKEAATLLEEAEDRYEALQAEFDALQLENAGLAEQIQVLSDAINQREAEDEAAREAEDILRMPTGFPITGSVTEGEPPEEANALEMAVYYEAAEGAVVVATARGIISSVRENAYGNYEIIIDHGNGYASIYTNAGFPLLSAETEVLKGTPLFSVGPDNTLTKYQISQNNVLVDVYSVMHVEG